MRPWGGGVGRTRGRVAAYPRRSSSLPREPAVQLAVGAFVDASHPGTWMARSEGDESPDKRLLLAACELEHERERALRRRSVARWQIELGAASELGLVWAEPFARPKRRQRDAMLLEMLAGCGSDGARPTGETAEGFAPDCFVETDRDPALGCGWAHLAFAVRRAHLLGEPLELRCARWLRSLLLVDRRHRCRHADLEQLRCQAIHSLGNALGLLVVQRIDGRERMLGTFQLTLQLLERVIGRVGHDPKVLRWADGAA